MFIDEKTTIIIIAMIATSWAVKIITKYLQVHSNK